MLKDGLGDNTEFSGYHPLVSLTYFGFVIGITMFSLSPWFLMPTLIFAWGYSVVLKGIQGAKMNLIVSGSILLVMSLINTFFTHNGETVLFYVNTNRITLEAFVYGTAAAIMLISVIIWFSCFNVIMSADKIIYIFSKIAPILGLTLSMIFRFVPLLKSRYKEIAMGQKCMRMDYKKGIVAKCRQLTKEISILIAWSLEASIESADSMEARGYGLRGRTSFHLFKFTKRDLWLLIGMFFLGSVVTAGCVLKKTSMFFYPKIIMPTMDLTTVALLVAYVVLLVLPIIIDLRGEERWRQFA